MPMPCREPSFGVGLYCNKSTALAMPSSTNHQEGGNQQVHRKARRTPRFPDWISTPKLVHFSNQEFWRPSNHTSPYPPLCNILVFLICRAVVAMPCYLQEKITWLMPGRGGRVRYKTAKECRADLERAANSTAAVPDLAANSLLFGSSTLL